MSASYASLPVVSGRRDDSSLAAAWSLAKQLSCHGQKARRDGRIAARLPVEHGRIAPRTRTYDGGNSCIGASGERRKSCIAQSGASICGMLGTTCVVYADELWYVLTDIR
jgi:hypothetical protein